MSVTSDGCTIIPPTLGREEWSQAASSAGSFSSADQAGGYQVAGGVEGLVGGAGIAAGRADVEDLVPLGEDDAVLSMAVAAILVGDEVGRRDDASRHAVVPSRLNCHAESTAIWSAGVLDRATVEGATLVTARRSAALGEGGVDHVGFDCLDIRVADEGEVGLADAFASIRVEGIHRGAKTHAERHCPSVN
jgi:hypothetical protein